MNKNDTDKYYTRFLVSDVKHKKNLQEHILYQLFRRLKNDTIPPQIISPEDQQT